MASSIEGTKVFSEYFKTVLKHPPVDRNQLLEKIDQVFQNIGSAEPTSITLGDKTITVELDESNLKIFSHFAKRFFHKFPLSETEASRIILDIEGARQRIPAQMSAVLKALEDAENEVYLHENIETRTESGAAAEVKQSLNDRIIKEQKEAQKLEEGRKDWKNTQRILTTVTAASSGTLLAAGLIMSLFIWPIGVALVVAGLGVALGGAYGLGKRRETEEAMEQDLDHAVEHIKLLQELKKKAEDPDFVDYCANPEKGSHEAVEADDAKFRKFFLHFLYDKYQVYDSNLAVREDLIEVRPDVTVAKDREALTKFKEDADALLVRNNDFEKRQVTQRR